VALLCLQSPLPTPSILTDSRSVIYIDQRGIPVVGLNVLFSFKVTDSDSVKYYLKLSDLYEKNIPTWRSFFILSAYFIDHQ
jgi:hypothetical protein